MGTSIQDKDYPQSGRVSGDIQRHVKHSFMYRRAKYLRLPTSSRLIPNTSRPRPFLASVFPRRRSITSEDENHQGEVNDAVVPTRKSLLSRSYLTQQALSEKSASRSEYAPSMGREPSPVRSIVSLPDRRPRSPGKALSVTETATENLWDAIRKAGQPRRQRRL